MASKNEIASVALRDLGGQPVSDFDNQKTKEAKLLQDYWDNTRDEVIAEFNWGFAKKWVALALETDTILDPKWAYKFALPSDYLKISKEETEKSLGTNYEIRGQSLFINQDTCLIEYIYSVEDTTKWPKWFIEAIIARLRSKLQIPLSKSGTKVVNWYQIYLIELAKAQSIDSEQSNPTEEEKGNHTTDNDTWLNSRLIT